MCKIQNLFMIITATVMFWSHHALSDARFGTRQMTPQGHEDGEVIPVQFTIELGNSSGSVRELLESQGYSEVQITESGFTTVRAQACFQGSRYLIKVKTIGARISRLAKIGECQPVLSSSDIVNQLKSDGYSRISLDIVDGDIYQVQACRGDSRMRLRINRYGKIVGQDKRGRCRNVLDAAEVRQRLREKHFDRIKLVSESPRQFTFEACKGRDRVNLHIRTNGSIRREIRVGNCAPPIELWQVKSIVENRGYNRVVVVDKNSPVYGVEACQGTRLMHIRLDRFGEIRNTKQIGECEPALNEKTLDAHLRERGENRIVVEARGSGGFIVQSCYKNQRHRTEFDLYGTVLDRKMIGECSPAPRLTQIIRQFEKQNITNPNLVVEGCKNGRLYRYQVNVFGEIRNSKSFGKCR